MKTKHTNGPWAIDSELPPNGRSVIARTSGGIPISANFEGPHPSNQDGPNAKLISCAPELLAALESLLDCPDLCLQNLEPGTIKACDTARAAIAKAKCLK